MVDFCIFNNLEAWRIDFWEYHWIAVFLFIPGRPLRWKLLIISVCWKFVTLIYTYLSRVSADDVGVRFPVAYVDLFDLAAARNFVML